MRTATVLFGSAWRASRRLPEVRAIWLAGQTFTDAGLAHLSGLTALQELHLRLCVQISVAGIRHLGALKALQELTLAFCSFPRGDADLYHLRGLPSLKKLRIEGGPDSLRLALPKALPDCDIQFRN